MENNCPVYLTHKYTMVCDTCYRITDPKLFTVISKNYYNGPIDLFTEFYDGDMNEFIREVMKSELNPK